MLKSVTQKRHLKMYGLWKTGFSVDHVGIFQQVSEGWTCQMIRSQALFRKGCNLPYRRKIRQNEQKS